MKNRLAILALTISILANGTLFYLYWVNRIDTTPIFDPFEINYNVTESSLVKAGYTWLPEDVPLLGKHVGDTLIYYQLDYECSNAIDIKDIECENTGVYWRNCVIYLDKVDSIEMSRLADRYDAEILGEFQMRKSFVDTNNLRADFFIRHKFSQIIFDCSIERTYYEDKKGRYELSIQTSFPYTKERIKREIEDRQAGHEYNKFNDILGKERKEVSELLTNRYNIKRVMHMRLRQDKGVDSVQIVFETEKHTYILSCVNDTLKYISVTYGTETHGLMKNMELTFGRDSLESTQDDFLDSYLKKAYSTAGLFGDEKDLIIRSSLKTIHSIQRSLRQSLSGGKKRSNDQLKTSD